MWLSGHIHPASASHAARRSPVLLARRSAHDDIDRCGTEARREPEAVGDCAWRSRVLIRGKAAPERFRRDAQSPGGLLCDELMQRLGYSQAAEPDVIHI